MKQLLHLRPAEALLVLQAHQASGRQLLKVTFADLVLRDALRIRHELHQPSPHDPPSTIAYVTAGPALPDQQLHPHEQLFLIPFQATPQRRILLRHYVRLIFQYAQSAGFLRWEVAKSPNLAAYFHKGFFQRLFCSLQPTPAGEILRLKLEAELAQLNKELPQLTAQAEPDVTHFWRRLGGTALLLNLAAVPASAALFEQAFPRPVPADGSSTSSGCSSSWDSTSDSASSFDSGCFSGFGGGDSGGSGADGSGCSGDGGCSGCGGCGGD